MGKPIVMGRKTFESIGKALPGRLNIVVTRDRGFRAEGAEVAGSLEEALTLARVRGRCMAGADEICVVGGGEIYRQALPIADRLHVTHVLADFDGDARFPAIDPATWTMVASEDVPAGERDSHATRYAVYERRQSVHEIV
jgi:dihydrofolate reductase